MKDLIFSFVNWWNWLLTFTSGFANIGCLLLFHHATTHHTGNISRIAISMASGNWAELGLFFLLAFCFFAGSVLCGMLFHSQTMKPKKRYGMLLIVLGLLLLVVSSFFSGNPVLYTIAFLSGAQNAMFLYIKSFLARSTHLTGYLTDSGFALGRILAGYMEDLPKLFFNFSQIIFFLLGGISAATYIRHFPDSFVPMIAVLYILGGVIYFIARRGHLFGIK